MAARAPTGDRSELIAALRQCDGSRVMCLVTVRDDFWLGLSRFLAELEVEMVAGHNMAMLDLFDRRHARRVLAAFGRAYECLPAEPQDMKPDQERFLDQAVDSLAQNDKVVCVRLSLLAEMLKGKTWQPAILHEMGGAEGIGAAFLEDTFASPAADTRYRLHGPAARSVLQALLPAPVATSKGTCAAVTNCCRRLATDAHRRVLMNCCGFWTVNFGSSRQPNPRA